VNSRQCIRQKRGKILINWRGANVSGITAEVDQGVLSLRSDRIYSEA
jgi:hypothetical protein